MGLIVFRVIATIMIVLLIISCIVQYNDPDPLLWILAYAAAALLTVPPMLKKDNPLPIVAALIYLAWAAVLFKDYFGMEERTEFLVTEIAREGGGLAFALLWMFVLIVRWAMVRRSNVNPE